MPSSPNTGSSDPARSTPGDGALRRRWWCRRRGPCARRSAAGRASSRSRIEAMMVSKSENERPVAPGPPLKRVSPPKTAPSDSSSRHTPPGECPGVWRTSELLTGHAEHVAVGERHVRRPMRVDAVPEHPVGGMQGDRRPRRAVGQVSRHVDVVVVAMGAGDQHDPAVPDGLEDRLGVVGGVDDQHLGVVADQPDVVLDLEIRSVQGKDAVGAHPLDTKRGPLAPAPSRWLTARRPSAGPRPAPCGERPPRPGPGRWSPRRNRRDPAGPAGRGRSTSGNHASAGSPRTTTT